MRTEKKQKVEEEQEEVLISQITMCQSLAAPHKGSVLALPLISAFAIGEAAIDGNCFTACQT